MTSRRRASRALRPSEAIDELTAQLEACPSGEKSAELQLLRGEALFQLGRDEEAVDDLTEGLRSSKSAAAYYVRGSAYNRLGHFAKAIDDYQLALDMDEEKSVKSTTKKPRSVALGADAYAKLREHELRQQIQSQTDDSQEEEVLRVQSSESLAAPKSDDAESTMKTRAARAAHARGVDLRRQGDFRGAVTAYTEALELDPSNFRCYFDRAFARDAMGDIPGAIDDYSVAISVDPAPLAWYNRGIARSRQGDPRGAAADFGEAIDRASDAEPVADFYHNRAYCKREMGDLPGAIADYDASLSRKKDHFKSLYHRAFCLDALGDAGAALRDYDAAVRLRPSHAAVHHNRGVVLGKLERPSEALEAFDTAVAVAKENRGDADDDDTCVSAALYARALVLERLDRPDDARASLEQAVAERPDDSEFYHALGTHFRRHGIHDKAVDAFSSALDKKCDHLRRRNALANRAYSLRKLGNFGDAIRDYSDALDLAEAGLVGDDYESSSAGTEEETRTETATVVAKLRNARAYCFARAEETSRAIDDYSAAIDLDPLNSHAFHNRGIIYDRLGESQRAMADFTKVLELEERHQRTSGDSSAAAILRQTKLHLALSSSRENN